MYEIISKYIFEEKEPLNNYFKVHTTYKMYKAVKKIALDNNMSVSMLINNALAYYIIHYVKIKGRPRKKIGPTAHDLSRTERS